jgi:glycerol-1-phosphate dehydrogenase [NAD(P)+]
VPVLARMVAAPLHVEVRPSALADLPRVLADRRLSNQGNIALVVGAGIGSEVLAALPPDLATAGVFTVTDGSLEAALVLSRDLQHRIVDVVVAVGGGRTIDVTKYAASRLGLPVVVVATSLAHDGLASPVSVLDVDGDRVSFGVATPLGVLVDLDLVRRSPHPLVASGVADVVSNLSAVADWELAAEHRGEPLDGLACMLARSAAEAVLLHREEPRSTGFLRCLAESLILSGTAMAVAGTSRPCSGACHEISHSIDLLYPDLRGYHGEQVGLGAAFATWLRKDEERLEDLVGALRWHGLPVVPEELGLDDEQFTQAVVHAPQTRPGRHTILEELSLTEENTRLAVRDYIATVTGPTWA